MAESKYKSRKRMRIPEETVKPNSGFRSTGAKKVSKKIKMICILLFTIPFLFAGAATIQGAASTEGDKIITPLSWRLIYANEMPTSNTSFHASAYGDGKYIVLSDSFSGTRNVAWSTDTISWDYASAPLGEWKDVIWGEETGLFVAVANTVSGTNRLMVSPDGLDWTAITTNTTINSNRWRSIAYGIINGSGMYIIAGQGSAPTLMLSSDGRNWVSARNTSRLYNGIVYGNNRFMAAGNDGVISVTANGTTWNDVKTPLNRITTIGYGNNKWLVASNTGQIAVSEDNGQNWKNADLPVKNTDFEGIAYGNGVFVAFGRNDINGIETAYVSINGIKWYLLAEGNNVVWENVDFAGGKFIGTGKSATPIIIGDMRLRDEYIEIIRQDENGNPLSGAEFRITGPERNELYSVDEYLQIDINGWKSGEYTITEEVSPKGYKLSNESTFKLNYPLLDEYQHIFKSEQCEVIIRREDINENLIEGASFRIRGNGVDETFTVDGEYSLKIGGWEKEPYTVTEEIPPHGYSIATQSQSFTLGNGTVHPPALIFRSSKNDILIIREDFENNRLNGSVYEILNKDSGQVIITDIEITENGEYLQNLGALSEGTYILKEKTPPKGYAFDDEPQEFVVENYSSDRQIFLFKSNKLKINIYRNDDEKNSLETGSTVIIKGEGREETVTINGSKTIDMDGWDDGDYTIEELFPPPGYERDTEIKEFEIKNGKVEPEDISFGSASNKLYIYRKCSDTGDLLNGAVVSITMVERFDGAENNSTDKADKKTEDERPEDTEHEYINASDYEQELVYENTIADEPLSENTEEIPGGTDDDTENDETDTKNISDKIITVDGRYILDMADWIPGRYVVKETTPPSEYAKDIRKYEVTLQKDGTLIPGEVVISSGSTNIYVDRFDADTGKKIEGAVYEIKGTERSETFPFVHESFVYNMSRWPYGTYTITEEFPPPGYRKDNKEWPFEIYSDGNIEPKNFSFESKQLSVTIHRICSATQNTLKGSKIRITGPGKDITVDVDNFFLLQLGGWGPGTYKLKEIKAPSGYNPDINEQEFTIYKEGEADKEYIIFSSYKTQTPGGKEQNNRDENGDTVTNTKDIEDPEDPEDSERSEDPEDEDGNNEDLVYRDSDSNSKELDNETGNNKNIFYYDTVINIEDSENATDNDKKNETGNTVKTDNKSENDNIALRQADTGRVVEITGIYHDDCTDGCGNECNCNGIFNCIYGDICGCHDEGVYNCGCNADVIHGQFMSDDYVRDKDTVLLSSYIPANKSLKNNDTNGINRLKLIPYLLPFILAALLLLFLLLKKRAVTIRRKCADTGKLLPLTFCISGFNQRVEKSAGAKVYKLKVNDWKDGIYEVAELTRDEYINEEPVQKFEVRSGRASKKKIEFIARLR